MVPRSSLVSALFGGLVVLVLAAGALTPGRALRQADDAARRCLATGSSCKDADYALAELAPWTAKTAIARRDELLDRTAIAAYVDAAAGRPDADARGQAARALEDRQMLRSPEKTPNRLRHLGPLIAGPRLGFWAAELGDTTRLVEAAKSDRARWYVKQAALRAALLEGQDAQGLAVHVLAGMPEELDDSEGAALTAALVLCLGDDHKQGATWLHRVLQHRDSATRAGVSRDRLEVVVAREACLARSKAPLSPTVGVESALVQAERAMLRGRTALASGSSRKNAAKAVSEALRRLHASEGLGNKRGQVMTSLLAMRLSLEVPSAEELERLLAPWQDGPLIEVPLDVPSVWAMEPRAVAAELSLARDQLSKAKGSSYALGDLELLSAVAAATGGACETDLWRQAISNQQRDGILSHIGTALGHRLAGDPKAALKELDAAKSMLAKDAPRPWRLSVAVNEAQAASAAGDIARARASVNAMEAGDPSDALVTAAAWTAVAFGALDTSEPAPVPWVGYGSNPSKSAEKAALSQWQRGPGRDARLTWLSRRGDAPTDQVAYLAVAQRLLDEGDAEVWLDAAHAIELRHTPLRYVAWTRAELATMRGDADASKKWLTRLSSLRALVSRHDAPVLIDGLGI